MQVRQALQGPPEAIAFGGGALDAPMVRHEILQVHLVCSAESQLAAFAKHSVLELCLLEQSQQMVFRPGVARPHTHYGPLAELRDSLPVRQDPRLDALVDDPNEQIGRLTRSAFDEFLTKCHGASLTVPIEVAENNVRMNAGGFPVLRDILVNHTLAVDTPDFELVIVPPRRTHESVDNRFVRFPFDDDLGVDISLHRLPGSQGNRASIDSVDALRFG